MKTGKKLQHKIIEKVNIKHLLSHFTKTQLALTFNVSTGFIDRTLTRQSEGTKTERIEFKYFFVERLDKAVRVVCEHYGVTIEQLKYQSRIREFAEPRKLLYYILYYEYYQSPSLLGTFFNRTHSAVLTSAKAVKNRLEVDSEYRKELKNIFEQLNLKK